MRIASRREHLLLAAALSTRAFLPAVIAPAPAAAYDAPGSSISRGVPELSNSIVASRDTNISPKEIYIQLRDEKDLRPERNGASDGDGRVLDLGAGAGVSTQALWDVGWRKVTAVDPSRLAWDRFANEKLPPNVEFYHASDEQFVAQWEEGQPQSEKFNLVVLNYAVNHDKAVRFAKTLLKPGGHLLAPTNAQNNYWFAQQYEYMNDAGSVLWTKDTLGSYAVLFQPDFTNPACQGQWCPGVRSDDAAKQLRLLQGL